MLRHGISTTPARSIAIAFLVAACLVLLGLAERAGAASGDLAWQRAYNGTGNDDDYYVGAAPAPNGGVYVAGAARPDAGGMTIHYDFLVARYAASGQRQWLRTLDGPGHFQDFVNDVASDSRGNVVAAGLVNYLALTPQVAAVVKYGAQGQRRWVRYYDDPNATAEQATNVVIDAAGNIYVAGESVASASGYDVFLVKYSSSGTRKWVRHFTGPGNGQDRIEDIAVDGYGNVYLTGFSYSPTTDFDMVTLKYKPNGTRGWTRRLDGPASSSDYGHGIAVTNAGTVYVAGEIVGTATGADAAVVKYSSGGAFKWMRTRTSIGANNDAFQDIALLGNGDVAAAGRIDSTVMTADSNALLVRLSPAGGTRWAKTYDGPDHLDDEGHTVASGAHGAIYVSGTTTASASLLDILTLKYSGNGHVGWARTHSSAGAANDFDGGLVAVTAGVYSAGKQQETTGNDAILLKYRP